MYHRNVLTLVVLLSHLEAHGVAYIHMLALVITPSFSIQLEAT